MSGSPGSRFVSFSFRFWVHVWFVIRVRVFVSGFVSVSWLINIWARVGCVWHVSVRVWNHVCFAIRVRGFIFGSCLFGYINYIGSKIYNLIIELISSVKFLYRILL